MLIVTVAVLVVVTAVGLAVSEVSVGPQLRPNPNDAEPACGMASGETWLLSVSLYQE